MLKKRCLDAVKPLEMVGFEAESDLATNMYKLIPSVCDFFSKEERIHSDRFLQYMRLMASGSFPTTNICYRVFLDLIPEAVGYKSFEVNAAAKL